MIPITYLRSSSYGAWSMCQQSYLLGYPLNIRQSSFKAERGSLTHKALELLARKKLADQNGEPTFHDEELAKTWSVEPFTPDMAFEAAVEHYVPNSQFRDQYTPKELKIYRGWLQDTIEFHDGLYNPLKRTILWPEKHFDLEIEREWAEYNYELPDGNKASGRLRIKGTMDLICRVDGMPNAVELADWKTGARLDWATGEVKTIKKLRDDPQLRLYHYALSRLLPEVDQIIVSIIYSQVKDNPKKGMRGGPYTLPPFTKDDLPKTEQMIRERFEEIRDSSRPKLNKSWRCKSFCYYGKNSFEGSQNTMCEDVHQELLAVGLDRVLKNRGSSTSIMYYGDGGGVSNRGLKEAAK